MKIYKNILFKVLFLLVLTSNSSSQELLEGDITLELDVLPTGGLTLNTWNSLEGLWSVRLENTTNQIKQYRLYFEMRKGNQLMVYGLTPIEILLGGKVKTYRNQDPEISDPYYLDTWYSDSEFESYLNALGYMPTGNYILKVAVVKPDVSTFNPQFIPDSQYSDQDFETLEFSFGDNLELIESFDDIVDCNNELAQNCPEIVFEWSSPGFSGGSNGQHGVYIKYNLEIAGLIPGILPSASDALEYGEGALYYSESNWGKILGTMKEKEGEWVYEETGHPVIHSVDYASLVLSYDFDQFICGYEYAWRISAQEYIPNYEGGVWGYPDPVQTRILTFRFGDTPEILLPITSDPLETVLPEFKWVNIKCATYGGDGYELELKHIDEELDGTALIDVIDFSTSTYTYDEEPENLVTLEPGEDYHWRVRIAQKDNYPTDWSQKGNFSIEPLEAPTVEVIDGSTSPIFNIKGPIGIYGYHLVINEMYSENDGDLVFDSRDIPGDNNFKQPDETGFLSWEYIPQAPFWELYPNLGYSFYFIPIDKFNNEFSPSNTYIMQNTELIDAIELQEPEDGEIAVKLNKLFKWDSPIFPNFLFELTSIEDNDFDDPIVSEIVSTTNYQFEFGVGYQLERATEYQWRVVPLNTIFEPGSKFSYLESRSFTTSENSEIYNPTNGSSIASVRPTFEIRLPDEVNHIKIRVSDDTDENLQNENIYKLLDSEQIFPASTNPKIVNWQYPDQGISNGFHPGMKYYWQYLMYDDNSDLIGVLEDDYEVYYFNINPIKLDIPENGEKNIALDPIFYWSGLEDVREYELRISDSNDPELSNPNFIISGITNKNYEYPKEGEFPLIYQQTYYWTVLTKDISGSYGTSDLIISQFTTSDFPELGEDLDESPLDPRVPIVKITTMDGITYTILIYSDSDGNTLVDEVEEVVTFPYEYTEGTENFEYGITYYIQVQPIKNGEIYGPPSMMMPFSVPQEDVQQCEIQCSVPEESLEPEIFTEIMEGVDGATEYLIYVSENQDMSNAQIIPFSSSSPSHLVTSEYVNWGQTYYTQVVGIGEDELTVGLPSDIQIVSIQGKPGSDQQTAISVSLSDDDFKPSFEIINEIQGATGYRIEISTQSDMTVDFFQFEITNSTFSNYPGDAPNLIYGQSYYVIAQGFDEGGDHGINSNIVAYFVPNIVAPILGDEFNWESTIPPSEQYILDVSLVEDFSVPVLNRETSNTNYQFNMDEFEYGRGYYWRVQGQYDGLEFGSASQVKFFETPQFPEPVLNSFSSEVSLLPEFSWSGIETISLYKIKISSDGSMENILWEENLTENSVVYSESAILLTYATNYFWQIIAFDESENILSQSQIEEFSTTSLFPVTNLIPDGGIETLEPTLEWELNDNFLFYNIKLASDPDMSNLLIDEKIESNSFKIADGILNSGTEYYWLVDGLGEENESLAGSSEVVSMITPNINTISLITPENGAQVGNLIPTFKWSAAIGVESYTLEVSLESEFESSILNLYVSGTDFSLTEENKLINSNTYYWRVQGVSEDDVIVSSTSNFSTPESANISIQSLENGAEVSVTNPVFSWEGGEEISAYQIRFDTKSDFTESWSFTIGTTSFEYPGEPILDFEVAYYWQVLPLDQEGNAIGDWTESRNFSINAAFIVELIAPENGETASSSNPAFQWNAIENAAKYEIEVSSNEDFSEILWSSSEIVENTTQYPQSGADKLEYDIDYYWHVRARDEENPLGDYSGKFSFNISGQNQVILEGPLSASETNSPYFSWEAVPGTVNYTFTLASDESVSAIIYNKDIAEEFFQYPEDAPPLSNSTVYYWNVTAKDDSGTPIGDPSAIGSFTTPSGSIEIEFMFGDD